ncbi:MAG: hypothetical protein LBU50_03970 [Cellulomonas sp.]|jgi:hypothetical protein|nr:hypothetical protein [Cellulomonas sp.]
MTEPTSTFDRHTEAQIALTEARRSVLRTIEALAGLTWLAVIVPLVVMAWRAAW